jgi:hypothetical protein
MAQLSARVRRREALTPGEAQEMFALYRSYYDGTSAEIFRDDLGAKSHVIELHAGGRLRGFSTLAVLRAEAGRAIFSGDTIIHHEFWGEQALAAAFCRFAGALKAEETKAPLFWLLISKGYRTYRYLSAFARAYYPHHVHATPPPVQEQMRRLARAKFGDAYDAAAGVVRFPQSRGHLKPEWALVRPQLRMHPAVRFFLERNPRFHAGEELVCLTELCADNMRSLARRAFLEGFSAAASRAPAP